MTCTGRRISGAFAVLLVAALSGGASAQEPAPPTAAPPPTATVTPAPPQPAGAPAAPAAPALEQVLELRRSNFVLRQNLLAAQMQNLKNMIDQENAAITSLLKDLRTDIEKAHPGWTLGDDGVVAKKQAAAATPKK